MSGKEDTSGEEVASGGVRTPDGPGTGEPQGLGPGAVEQGPDAMVTPSSCGAAMVVAPLVQWKGTSTEMHQGGNLMASIQLTWDNTSWRVASVWLIICALFLCASWPVWLSYVHTFQPIPVPPRWAHIPVGLWLDWLPIEVRVKGDTLTLLSGYCQDDSLTHLLSRCWQGDCLILPQSGCTLPEVT